MPIPPGLILNPATGELEGTPTQAGTFNIELKVRDVLGNQRELTDEVIINPYTPMTWTGVIGRVMVSRAVDQVTLALSGGLPAFGFTVEAGTIPDGLTLNASTGAITGTPTTPGQYTVTIRCTDGISQTKDVVLVGEVKANLTLSYTTPIEGTATIPIADQSPTTAGGTTPYTYSVVGSLPSGLALNASTGVLSGASIVPYNGTITMRVTDAEGFTTDFPITVNIVAFPTISGSFTAATANVAYSRTFTGAGGHPPYSWSSTGLPSGLTINSGNGVVSGTPTVPGFFDPVITLTDNIGIQTQITRPLEVAPNLVLSGTYTPNITVNVAYPTFFAVATGGYTPYTFDVSVGSLPTGLTLVASGANAGRISGTPTAAGAYTATLRVTDNNGNTATMPFNVTVNNTLSMSGAVPGRGTTTVAYTGDTLSSAGGTTPHTWNVVAGSLPTGIALNNGTGDLSGIPTTAGTYNFTIRVTDASGLSVQNAYSIIVAAFPTLTGDLPDASNGVAYSESLSRAGGHSPYTFDISAGALPTGLSINSGTGAITGTPTANGAFNFTVRVTDDAGNVATRADAITVYAVPVVSGTVTNEAEVGDAYSATQLSVSGGKPTVGWSLAGGTMPPGLSINSGNGDITGTPTTAGTYNFTVRATDTLGRSDTSAQVITVRAVVRITSIHRTGGTIGVAYSGSAAAANGWTPYTWAIVSGAIPTGTTLNTSTGAITGTPSATGGFAYTLRVTDALSVTHSLSNTITIASAVALSGAAPKGTIGVAYSFTPTRSGGWGPFTYSIVSGTLPPGVSLNASTGTISGTPTTANTYNFTVRCRDTGANGGSQDDLALSIVIAAAPTFTLNYGHGTVGKSYSGTVTASGGHAPLSYSHVAGTLPPGLGLSSSTGSLTGTPTSNATYSFTIRVRDALGNIFDRAGSIVVAAAVSSIGDYADGKVGVGYNSDLTPTGGWGPHSFSLVAGSLPPGLALTASTGTISGTPTTANTYNFTVRCTDSEGTFGNRAFSVVIAPSTPLTSVANPNPASAYEQTGFFNPITVTVESLVTISGGTPPYTLLGWTMLSGNGTPTPLTISFPTPDRIRGSLTGSTVTRIEDWRLAFRDSAGVTGTQTVQLSIIIEGTGFNDSCVDFDSFLPDGRRVRDVHVGDLVECIDVSTGARSMVPVNAVSFSWQPSYRLRTDRGTTLIQSESTPMDLLDGRVVNTPEMRGELVAVVRGPELSVEWVEAVEPIGIRKVVRISLGGRMFFAGESAEACIATHNQTQKP